MGCLLGEAWWVFVWWFGLLVCQMCLCVWKGFSYSWFVVSVAIDVVGRIGPYIEPPIGM